MKKTSLILFLFLLIFSCKVNSNKSIQIEDSPKPKENISPSLNKRVDMNLISTLSGLYDKDFYSLHTDKSPINTIAIKSYFFVIYNDNSYLFNSFLKLKNNNLGRLLSYEQISRDYDANHVDFRELTFEKYNIRLYFEYSNNLLSNLLWHSVTNHTSTKGYLTYSFVLDNFNNNWEKNRIDKKMWFSKNENGITRNVINLNYHNDIYTECYLEIDSTNINASDSLNSILDFEIIN